MLSGLCWWHYTNWSWTGETSEVSPAIAGMMDTRSYTPLVKHLNGNSETLCGLHHASWLPGSGANKFSVWHLCDSTVPGDVKVAPIWNLSWTWTWTRLEPINDAIANYSKETHCHKKNQTTSSTQCNQEIVALPATGLLLESNSPQVHWTPGSFWGWKPFEYFWHFFKN